MKLKKSTALTSIPTDIKDIATSIAMGQVKNAKMEWHSDGTLVFSADSFDGGARIIMEKREFSGVVEHSKKEITKPISYEERLKRVASLKKRGLSQMEIRHYTMTSQKTVSNDIQELKKRGLLET